MKPILDPTRKAGKIHRIAIVASMRKLLVILNARVRDALRPASQISTSGA